MDTRWQHWHSSRHGTAHQLWQRSQFGLGNCAAKALIAPKAQASLVHEGARLLTGLPTCCFLSSPVLPPDDQPSQLNLGMLRASASISTASACAAAGAGGFRFVCGRGLGMLRPPATGSVGAFLPCTGALACWELNVPVQCGSEAASVHLPQWQLKQPGFPCSIGN